MVLNRAVLLAALSTLGLPASAAPEIYIADPAHTFPAFEISHLGFSTMRGRFDKTAGKILLDPATKKGSVEVSIDATSINTGHQKRDDHLRGPDFFNVEKFPALTFKSKEFALNGDKLTKVPGELTLLGVTKPVTLQVTGFRCGAHPVNKKEMCGVDASTSIKRSDFGMKYGLPAVGDDVKIAVELEALRD